MPKPSESQVKFSGKQRNQRNGKSAATKLRTNSISYAQTSVFCLKFLVRRG